MFISPAQQIATDTSERNNAFNLQFAKNKLAAMPSALDQALGGFLDWIATTGESVAAVYAGSMAGADKKTGGGNTDGNYGTDLGAGLMGGKGAGLGNVGSAGFGSGYDFNTGTDGGAQYQSY
jgi:hypothetical protein